ncbi:MAG: hypothetical protein JXQ65_10215 [Candidatus Marinimicrobia bacterium]|nr:hypothetical protein [Candidatus Neomarinimicrobiota bacterium]
MQFANRTPPTMLPAHGQKGVRLQHTIVRPLVKKKAFFGPNYQSKRYKGMPGNKALAAMMQKFLKTFYGW